MYNDLVSVHKTIGLDFSKVTSFNLDEYVGMPPENEQSYHYFMEENFFKHINIRREAIHVPDGMAADVSKECRDYDRMIEQAGGIDLQVLGIGRNAHIGFNEPDIKFEATTHQVRLDDETIEANSRFFSSQDEVPRYAVSMGIKNIMLAGKVLLLANGKEKAEAVRAAVCGTITPQAPASILQLHRDVTLILDREAAALLPENLK